MKKFIILGTIAAILLTGCDMTRKPKSSYIDRVREVCGPRIAAEYANTKWKDRDYAQDYFLGTCILFPGDTRLAGKEK